MSIKISEVKRFKVANIFNDSQIGFFAIVTYNGAVYETPSIAGVAHFAEHMAFKGTTNRDWRQINRDMSRYGIQDNAYTSNGEILYHTKFPLKNAEKAVEILTDMFFNSTIPEEEVEKERGVILEERGMTDDDPMNAFYDHIGTNMMSWQIGHNILGTKETISAITRDDIEKYLLDTVSINNTMFIFCGNFSDDEVDEWLDKYIPDDHKWSKGYNSIIANTELWTDNILQSQKKIKYKYKREGIDQSQVFGLTEGISQCDPDFFKYMISVKCIGGGGFSYMWERIREELGLCYSTGSGNSFLLNPDLSITNFYCFLSDENVDGFIAETENILKSIAKDGLDPDIFECAKNEYLSKILSVTEASLGKAHTLYNRIFFDYLIDDGDISSYYERLPSLIGNIRIEECNDKLAQWFAPEKINWAVMSKS